MSEGLIIKGVSCPEPFSFSPERCTSYSVESALLRSLLSDQPDQLLPFAWKPS